MDAANAGRRTNRRDLGRVGEDVALEHLRGAGYRLIARNVRTRYGEIDLVCERRGTIVFVEVRSKTGARFGTGLESVDLRKQRQLARLAADFLVRRRLTERRARFDVVGVDWQDGRPTVDHLENAFEMPADW